MHLSFPDDIIFQFSSIWGTLLCKKPKSVAVDGSILRHTCVITQPHHSPLSHRRVLLGQRGFNVVSAVPCHVG